MIREIVDDGTTLLLTTQYLEEADALADEIVVIDRGKELARGTSSELKDTLGGERIEFTVLDADRTEEAADLVRPHAAGELVVEPRRGAVGFAVEGGDAQLGATVRALEGAGIRVADLSLRRASLDDVFLALTGRTAESDASTLQEAT